MDFVLKPIQSAVQTKNGQLMIGTGFALIALLSLSIYQFNSNGSKSKDGVELLPALTEEEVLDIMNKLLDQLKSISTQMVRAAEGIKQQIAQQGKEIDDKKLMEMFILPHVESSFREAQDKLLTDFEVEESELEDGVTYYSKHGHKKIKEIADRIKLIYKEFGGDIDDEEEDEDDDNEMVDTSVNTTSTTVNESGQLVKDNSSKKKNGPVTLEKVIEVLEVIVEEMTKMTEQFVAQYVATYGPPANRSELEAFQMQYLTLSEQVENQVTENFNIPTLKFQKALQNFSSSQEIQSIILKLQQLNIMAMAEHGIDFSKFM